MRSAETRNNESFEAMLRREFLKTPVSERGDCPGPETLASFYDRSMLRADRYRVEGHLLECRRCQSMIAGLVRMEAAAAEESRNQRWARFIHIVTPLSVAAAAIMVFIWLRIEDRNTPDRFAMAPKIASLDTGAPAGVRLFPESTRKHRGDSRRDKLADQTASEIAGQNFAENKKAKPLPVMPRPMALAMNPPALSIGGAAPAAPTASTSAAAPAAPKPGAEAPVEAPAEGNAKEEAAGTVTTLTRNNENLDIAIGAPMAKTTSLDLQAMNRSHQQEHVAALSMAPQRSEAQQSEVRAALQPAIGHRYTEIISPNGNRWAIGAGGAIMRWDGASWSAQKSGVNNDLLAGSAPSSTVCWIAGSNGTLLRTSDGGADWIKVSPPSLQDLVTISAQDFESASVSAGNGVKFMTRDGGNTWTSQ